MQVTQFAPEVFCRFTHFAKHYQYRKRHQESSSTYQYEFIFVQRYTIKHKFTYR